MEPRGHVLMDARALPGYYGDGGLRWLIVLVATVTAHIKAPRPMRVGGRSASRPDTPAPWKCECGHTRPAVRGQSGMAVREYLEKQLHMSHNQAPEKLTVFFSMNPTEKPELSIFSSSMQE
ncbi:hypothetical protein NDU88_009687 [Pleurodeles waltl]|uniref:Uncharacterized protein n=1 Tax=Pleurodeles waltl TaxID=8319 RepID=A0AAV7PWI6_PLEWA|nr:hypothetical protein NDU88_009687 [Pleurodeles waltl]